MITASGWTVWPMGSSPCDDRKNVPRQLALRWIGMACCTRTASSGGWRGAHYSSVVLSIAARQIVVQRAAALKFSQRRSQPSTYSDGVDTVLDGLSIRSKIDATWKQWNQSTCLSARGWLPRQKPPVGRNTALTLRIWHRPQFLPRVCAFVRLYWILRALAACLRASWLFLTASSRPLITICTGV